jgi:hypothetical protein
VRLGSFYQSIILELERWQVAATEQSRKSKWSLKLHAM